MQKLTKNQVLKGLGENISQSQFVSGVLTGETPKGATRIIIVIENYAIKRILFEDRVEGIGIAEGLPLLQFLSYFFIHEIVASTKLRWTWEPNPDREPKRSGRSSTGRGSGGSA